MLMWLLLLLLTIILSTQTENITENENAALKHECGSHFLVARNRHVRSIGGRLVVKDEFPWVAAVFRRRVILDYPHWQIDKQLCSGVQLSGIHVLTAAHCLIRRHETIDWCRHKYRIELRYRFVILQKEAVVVMAGSSCNDPLECLSGSNIYYVNEITVHPEYDPCLNENDIAIITLTSNISRTVGSPICMPSKNVTRSFHMYAVGFGLDTRFWAASQNRMDRQLSPRALERMRSREGGEAVDD
ncbi:hypothetical protein DICVIV_13179 [Dictyocaulus viviparus]|uniref:Peptidase S1 domain-containing protein n=1 Tax=Dictyocaulus viviparus TaxID=29172 RepID=A0A0D8XEK8_DICVI|nr:hypothetical protein DICVIV_13179 [Dictyocaulus viviparus]